jgi:hypothetical protein
VRSELPQIVKDAQRMRAALEQAFTRMPRRYKYKIGTDLCATAKTIVFCGMSAWREPELRLEFAQQLDRQVRMLKLDLQLAKDVNAFGSWSEFEAIARLVESIGRQSGGWLRGLKPKGQNVPAMPAQRAQKLSSRSASGTEASP